MTTRELTRITEAERIKLEKEIEAEIVAVYGKRPTLASVNAEMSEDKWLRMGINAIHGLGRITGVFIREGVSAIGALLLLVGFAVLEAERIYTGMIQLDQGQAAAVILALGLVLANITLPIYRLRRQRTGEYLTVKRWTVRSQLGALAQLVFGQAQDKEIDVNHNPTLRVAEVVVLLATLFLAFYAVMGATMQQYSTLTWYAALARSVGGTFEEFVPVVIGLAVSVGGVFMLQSVSHEVAVRAIEERPEQVREVLEQKEADYNVKVAGMREELTERFMAAKVADKARKSAVRASDKRTDKAVREAVRVSASPDKILTWERENRPDMELTVREIADKIGINRDAVSRARRFISDELSGPVAHPVSSNGHSVS